MRTPKYLSNTSIQLFYSDRMEFYLKYLADERPPRMPQTQPMSIGSAFDAYVKAWLVERLFGVREEFALDKIFETQVEKQHRDWAFENGAYVFECYKRSGALADLLKELEASSVEPRFEFTIERSIQDIPLLGKPDVWFVTSQGLHVLVDWKVNGYCSRSAVSPKKGYLKLLDGFIPVSNKHKACHRDAQPMSIGGIVVNVAVHLEDVDRGWADQVCLYGWLMGEDIGAKFVTGIDQIVCKPGNPRPSLRVAQHRCRVSEPYQRGLWMKIKRVWDTIQSGHIFDDLTYEESKKRCTTLDDYHKAYNGDDPNEQWFQAATRG